MSFATKVTGKWILAGEHSVLRGFPALVFPLYSRTLTLAYEVDPRKKSELLLDCDGEFGEELQLLFWGVVEKGCELKNIRRNQLHGQVHLTSSIPVGAGLGASAALCVAIARWFEFLKVIQPGELYEFARTLENLFHGESSGVDIAVALSAKGLKFVRNAERVEINLAWQPKWYVSYCGKRGVTVECVKRVKALIANNPELGAQIDQEMGRSEELAENALRMPEDRGINSLVQAMNIARSCFTNWGLAEGAPDQHMQYLLEQGALAVKPTGSGGGGYVLSLWKESPPEVLAKKLISCF